MRTVLVTGECKANGAQIIVSIDAETAEDAVRLFGQAMPEVLDAIVKADYSQVDKAQEVRKENPVIRC
jgi:hypothetical protein